MWIEEWQSNLRLDFRYLRWSGSFSHSVPICDYSWCCIAEVDDTCVLDLPQLGVNLKWPLKMIGGIITQSQLLEPKPTHVTSYVESEWLQLLAFVQEQLGLHSAKGADAAVAAFVFLYISILG